MGEGGTNVICLALFFEDLFVDFGEIFGFDAFELVVHFLLLVY